MLRGYVLRSSAVDINWISVRILYCKKIYKLILLICRLLRFIAAYRGRAVASLDLYRATIYYDTADICRSCSADACCAITYSRYNRTADGHVSYIAVSRTDTCSASTLCCNSGVLDNDIGYSTVAATDACTVTARCRDRSSADSDIMSACTSDTCCAAIYSETSAAAYEERSVLALFLKTRKCTCAYKRVCCAICKCYCNIAMCCIFNDLQCSC